MVQNPVDIGEPVIAGAAGARRSEPSPAPSAQLSVASSGALSGQPPGPLPVAPPTSRSRRQSVVSAGQELALLLILYLGYRTGRLMAVHHEVTAARNAERLRGWESWLHLPAEALIQANVASEGLFRLANVYYVAVHFPIMIAFLLLGYLGRPRPEYRWARNLVVVQTGLALVLHLVFPLAPPRMFPQWGFIDTMTTYGPSAYDGAVATVANQFAAMPSLHVGWAITIAYVVLRTGPRWLAVPAGLHALITVTVVIVTANHWWLDGVVAIALLALTLTAFPEPGRHRLTALVPRLRRRVAPA